MIMILSKEKPSCFKSQEWNIWKMVLQAWKISFKIIKLGESVKKQISSFSSSDLNILLFYFIKHIKCIGSYW